MKGVGAGLALPIVRQRALPIDRQRKMKGILIDKDGELTVRKGALVIGECDMDIAERLIRAWQGEFKEAPLLGGNIDKLRNGIVAPFWRGEMLAQLKSQHIAVKRFNINNEEIEIEMI